MLLAGHFGWCLKNSTNQNAENANVKLKERNA